jgi:hypothetical protein
MIQLSKSKKRTRHAIIGARVAPSTGISQRSLPLNLVSLVLSPARVAPSTGISLLKPPPQQKEETQRLDLTGHWIGSPAGISGSLIR